ncbi:MAG TPA: hypothetical protein VF637_08725 [Sphingomicrobium sp.]|jgi:hypothetical protein
MIDQRTFTNCVRSLFNIDGHLLPELSRAEQTALLADPVRFFIWADHTKQDAIWREVSKRQALS